jgi:Xaa-Pro dipeptidase
MGQTGHKELAFSVSEYQERLDRVRQQIRARDLTGMLVHTPENIFYLSGYQTPGYYAYQTLLIPAEPSRGPVILVRKLEESNVKGLSWIESMRAYTDIEDPIGMSADLARDSGVGGKRLGVEKGSWFLTAENLERLRAALPDTTLVDATGLVEQARVIKSPAEIAYLRTAARAAEAALQAGLDATGLGKAENAIAAEIYRAAILAGCEYTSLPQFIASGYRATLAHATWSTRTVERGDIVYFEVCGTVQRYSAALFRCATIGPPSDLVQRMSETTIAALNRIIEIMKPGVACGEVATAWADAIVKGGFPRPFKRAGYSIGINFPPDWGEGHILSLKFDERTALRPGMVFHTPSSIRDYGVAFIGNSETLLVTDNGCEPLTNFARQHFVR